MLSPISYVSECKDVDEIMTLKLDSEFRSKLENLKPFILVLKSQEMARLSYLWVEKLCNCTTQEKLLRNKYLNILLHQIKKNNLKPPFNQHPPCGPLIPIESLRQNCYTDCSDSTTISYSKCLDAGDFNRDCKEIDFLQQNEKLEKFFDSSCASDISEWSSISHSNQTLKKDIPSYALEEEINTLKERISQALETKHVISVPSHSSVYTSTIINLENKLSKIQQNTFQLKSSIFDMEEKLEELQKRSNTCFSEQCKIKKLSQVYKNNLHILQVEHAKNLLKLEKQKADELLEKDDEYRKKLSELNNNFDMKIEKIREQYEKNSKYKDIEISNLSTTLEDNCFRIKEEMSRMKNAIENQSKDEESSVVLREKIAELKALLQKENKLRVKSEKKFQKKIKALVSETHRRSKISKLRLVNQRTELMKKFVETSQEQINSVVTQLETRYRKLLFSQQTQFAIQQQQYIDTIASLEAQCLHYKEINNSN